MTLRLPLLLLALVTALPGQNRDPDDGNPMPKRPIQAKEEAADVAREKGDGSEDGKEIKMSPEELANVGVRRGAGALCKFYLHTKPARLMPGQSGMVIITAALGGQAVLPSPAPIELTSPLQQGLVTLGNFEVQPAKAGQGTAPAYVGRPVYDNTARIEMPITLGANAVVGTSLSLAVEMRFELFDGQTGQSIGRFLDRAVGNVEVGTSLDPNVQGGYTPPTIDTGTAGHAGDADAVASTPVRTATKQAIGAAEPLHVAPAVPEKLAHPSSTAPGSLEVSEEGGFPSMLLIGGGALLAAVVLLIVGKKK